MDKRARIQGLTECYIWDIDPESRSTQLYDWIVSVSLVRHFGLKTVNKIDQRAKH